MSIVTAIIFIVLGCLIKYAKLYNLIAGYNAMSKEEKQKYDIQGIGNLFWVVMLFMAAIMILGYLLSLIFNNQNMEIVCFFIALIVGIPYLLIQSNSKKYKKEI